MLTLGLSASGPLRYTLARDAAKSMCRVARVRHCFASFQPRKLPQSVNLVRVRCDVRKVPLDLQRGRSRGRQRWIRPHWRHGASHGVIAVLFGPSAPARIPPVLRITKLVAILLAAVLLINQSAAFAYEQLHGTATEAVSDKSTLPPHDGGTGKDSCIDCAHGGHFQSHFLGHVTEATPHSFLPLVAAMASVFTAPPIPTASLEAPYRPPRNPGFLRTV